MQNARARSSGVVNGTMSDTRVARSPRASPDRTKKKAKGRHGGSRTGSGRKFAHEATSAACAAEAKKPGVIGLRAFMGMDAGKRQGAALVKIWKEGAKKRVGIFKGREAAVTKEQSLSKVVKRHLARTSSIPIFKKRDEKISIYEAK